MPEPTSGQQIAVTLMRAVVDAEEQVIGALRAHQDYTRGVLARLAAGESISAVFRDRPPAAHRAAIEETQRRFEETRTRMRSALIDVGMAEGMTNSEIAGLWGVSRQLVHRHAHTAPPTGRVNPLAEGD